MKAITICQPYAELILLGEKRVENRVWRPGYLGPLLIHPASRGPGWTAMSPCPRTWTSAPWSASAS